MSFYHSITSLDQLSLWDQPVFDEHTWLAERYFYQNSSLPPICIVDNHNLVLPFWREYSQWSNPICYHIDQHADLNTPSTLPDSLASIEDVINYTLDHTSIASFIVPALHSNIISTCVQIRSEYALLENIAEMSMNGRWSYLLDIDIDFWSMSSDTELTKHCTLLREPMQNALCVSIATSPAFIDQDRALHIVRKLLWPFEEWL